MDAQCISRFTTDTYECAVLLRLGGRVRKWDGAFRVRTARRGWWGWGQSRPSCAALGSESTRLSGVGVRVDRLARRWGQSRGPSAFESGNRRGKLSSNPRMSMLGSESRLGCRLGSESNRVPRFDSDPSLPRADRLPTAKRYMTNVWTIIDA